MDKTMAADRERIKADIARKELQDEKAVRPVAQTGSEVSASHSHFHKD
jgi:hypothetical protein